MIRRRLGYLSWPTVGAALGAIVLVSFIGAILLADKNSERKDDRTQEALRTIQATLDEQKAQNAQLSTDREKFRSQMLTSIQQLYDLGAKPIVTEPDVVPPAASPTATTVVVTTTTTTAPPSTLPPTTPAPTEPRPTQPPPTEPPTTDPPSTEPPSTDLPPTEPPPTTDTSTTTEGDQ